MNSKELGRCVVGPVEDLKQRSLREADHLLAQLGLRREPSLASTALGVVGWAGLGAVVGVGLGLWIGSPKTRRAVSGWIIGRIDTATEALNEAPVAPALIEGQA